jgi:hypothetical protein
MMTRTWRAESRWLREPDLSAWVAGSRLNLLHDLPEHAAEPAAHAAVERFVTHVPAAIEALGGLSALPTSLQTPEGRRSSHEVDSNRRIARRGARQWIALSCQRALADQAQDARLELGGPVQIVSRAPDQRSFTELLAHAITRSAKRRAKMSMSPGMIEDPAQVRGRHEEKSSKRILPGSCPPKARTLEYVAGVHIVGTWVHRH